MCRPLIADHHALNIITILIIFFIHKILALNMCIRVHPYDKLPDKYEYDYVHGKGIDDRQARRGRIARQKGCCG